MIILLVKNNFIAIITCSRVIGFDLDFLRYSIVLTSSRKSSLVPTKMIGMPGQ